MTELVALWSGKTRVETFLSHVPALEYNLCRGYWQYVAGLVRVEVVQRDCRPFQLGFTGSQTCAAVEKQELNLCCDHHPSHFACQPRPRKSPANAERALTGEPGGWFDSSPKSCTLSRSYHIIFLLRSALLDVALTQGPGHSQIS